MKIMHYLEILSTSISIISLIIVIYGAIIAFCAFIHNESRRFTGKYSFTATRELRADLGTYLLLGLEFLIASDILKTVLEPSLNELAILGLFPRCHILITFSICLYFSRSGWEIP